MDKISFLGSAVSIISLILSLVGMAKGQRVLVFSTSLFTCIAIVSIAISLRNGNLYHKRVLEVLVSIANNNKLHSLRAFAVIIQKHIERKGNKIKIPYIKFAYGIYETQNGVYDVKYDLQFCFKNTILNKWIIKNPRFSFYIILDNDVSTVSDLKKELNMKVVFEPEIYHSAPLVNIKNVTTSQIDNIKTTTSLYEVTVTLPDAWMRRSVNEIPVICNVSYIVKQNIDFSALGNQYNFVIIPYNYSDYKIKTCEVEILNNSKTELQLNCYKSTLKESEMSQMNVSVTNGNLGYKIEAFKIDMDAIYFIQIEK